MGNELMSRLEGKVQEMVDTLELYRMENADLKAANEELQTTKSSLEEQQLEWEQKLTALIEKFEKIESEGSSSEAESSSSAEVAPDKEGDADTAASASGDSDSEGSDSGTTTYQAPSYDTPNQGY
ncbi:MAG: cell division protein ZapB [SAR324 cluster bacterium]|jgi:cell division protein ZapB|nr:cell division protein ZapB [SAR324 cluster bacterium]|tara:strand:+ start:2472 stop:2846 length:375 start_codon:yes stop_codon:yes gene_type:complete